MYGALIEALRTWPEQPSRDPEGRLIAVARRQFLDDTRSDASSRRHELKVDAEPPPRVVGSNDGTLLPYFPCAHPNPSASSAVALTLRAVGVLTTKQIAAAYLVGGDDDGPVDQPGQTHRRRGRGGYGRARYARRRRHGAVRGIRPAGPAPARARQSGDVDLAAEAIRLTRHLASVVDHPEVQGLLALMLLHCPAVRRGRTTPACWFSWRSRTADAGTPRQ